MPGAVAPLLQTLLVFSLPAVLAVAPVNGAVRTVAMGGVSQAAILNAAIRVDGRLLSGNGDRLVLSGRRDRLARALLPLGVLAVPVTASGCSAARKG